MLGSTWAEQGLYVSVCTSSIFTLEWRLSITQYVAPTLSPLVHSFYIMLPACAGIINTDCRNTTYTRGWCCGRSRAHQHQQQAHRAKTTQTRGAGVNTSLHAVLTSIVQPMVRFQCNLPSQECQVKSKSENRRWCGYLRGGGYRKFKSQIIINIISKFEWFHNLFK